MARNRERSKLTGASVRRGVLYARVSSKEQEREGFSIPAQLKLLQDYATAQNIVINKEYVDVETAKESGRGNFNKMIAYLKRHPNVRTILVEKTDRLYRNLTDWDTLDKLEVELHFVKEGSVISDDSRSSEKFVHGIKVLMAKQYIDNLSEEASKGMLEKAEQGIWPSYAPMGYVNVDGPNGKRDLAIDPELGPIITRMFEWYATGKYSLKEMSEKSYEAGFVTRRYGVEVVPGSIHKMLKNPFYMGDFKWRGKTYQGTHEPLVSRDLWEHVQGVLAGRSNAKKPGPVHSFAFTGLITCGHCGCAVSAQSKKGGRYKYYHCTGFKGNCGEPYVREEALEEQFIAILKRLRFDDEVFEWITLALKGSRDDEKREHDQAIKRLEKKRDVFQQRIEAMYVDKLDGRVTEEFYDKMLEQWRKERDRCTRDIARHQLADDTYMDEGIRLLKLAKNASRIFQQEPAESKSRLLKLLVSNCSLMNRTLHVEFLHPFDLLEEAVNSTPAAEGPVGADPRRYEIWRATRVDNANYSFAIALF